MSRSEEALSIDYGDESSTSYDSESDIEEPVEDYYSSRHGVVRASSSYGAGEQMEIVFDGDNKSFDYADNDKSSKGSKKSSKSKQASDGWEKNAKNKLLLVGAGIVALIILIVVIAVPLALKGKSGSSKLETAAASKGQKGDEEQVFDPFKDVIPDLSDAPPVTDIETEELTSIPTDPETYAPTKETNEVDLIDPDDDSLYNATTGTVAPTGGATDADTTYWWQGDNQGDDDGFGTEGTETETWVPTTYWWQNSDSTSDEFLGPDETTSNPTTWNPTTFPTAVPTPGATASPTASKTASPTTKAPSPSPTVTVANILTEEKDEEVEEPVATPIPTLNPTKGPTENPTPTPTAGPTRSPTWEPWPSVVVTTWPTYVPTTWEPTITITPTKHIDYPFYFPHLNGGDAAVADAAIEGEGPIVEDEIFEEPNRRAEVEVDSNGNVLETHSFFNAR
mmetsp:Transcript_12142/g.34765  ORF Transcript_12142/g.34765 Transcript_12142/m.34765 type:complete len:451 (+) Transcript_12142:76-1428(+)